MRFYAHHGCFEEEQAIGTWFEVSLRIKADTTKAETSDQVGDTVNYADIYTLIQNEMRHPSHLLEHVARRMINTLKSHYPTIEQIWVCVAKLNPPLGGEVGSSAVELDWNR